MTSDLKNVYLCNLSSELCGAGYRCGNLGSPHQAQNFILVIEYLKQEGEDGVVTEQRSALGGGVNLCGNHICTDLNARKVLKICVRQQQRPVPESLHRCTICCSAVRSRTHRRRCNSVEVKSVRITCIVKREQPEILSTPSGLVIDRDQLLHICLLREK